MIADGFFDIRKNEVVKIASGYQKNAGLSPGTDIWRLFFYHIMDIMWYPVFSIRDAIQIGENGMAERKKHLIRCTQCIFKNRCGRTIIFTDEQSGFNKELPIQGCEEGIHMDEAAMFFLNRRKKEIWEESV